jgi:hypothetical protein
MSDSPHILPVDHAVLKSREELESEEGYD